MSTVRIAARVSTAWHRLLPPQVVRRGFQSELEQAPAIGDVSVRLASTLDEHQQAFTLLHDAYVGRGITAPSPSGMRFSVHSLMTGTATFVAVTGDRVVGTIALVEDTPTGIPMESTHPEEVAAIRATGRRFAEVSTLAVTREYRTRLVALQLYNAMYRWAARHRGIDDLLLAVHPQIGPFFRHVLTCEKLGPTRSYSALNDAASTPFRLDLTDVHRRMTVLYDRPNMALDLHGESTNLFRYFVDDDVVPGVEIPAESTSPDGITPNPAWSDDDVRALLESTATWESGVTTGELSALASGTAGLTRA